MNVLFYTSWTDEFTHFTFDIWSHTEEQRTVEAQLNHVVPILRWQDSLKKRKQIFNFKNLHLEIALQLLIISIIHNCLANKWNLYS